MLAGSRHSLSIRGDSQSETGRDGQFHSPSRAPLYLVSVQQVSYSPDRPLHWIGGQSCKVQLFPPARGVVALKGQG